MYSSFEILNLDIFVASSFYRGITLQKCSSVLVVLFVVCHVRVHNLDLASNPSPAQFIERIASFAVRPSISSAARRQHLQLIDSVCSASTPSAAHLQHRRLTGSVCTSSAASAARRQHRYYRIILNVDLFVVGPHSSSTTQPALPPLSSNLPLTRLSSAPRRCPLSRSRAPVSVPCTRSLVSRFEPQLADFSAGKYSLRFVFSAGRSDSTFCEPHAYLRMHDIL